ncbi:MAG: AIR synthase-related protein, partial [Firmicutes bacterium]|nr:AIR synthase-related protein [Bacillota bacterium]
VEAVSVMAALNKDAAEAMQEVGVSGCTDITGFGLLGHASEMARASNVTMTIFLTRVPVLRPARGYVNMGIVPAGTRTNLKYVQQFVDFAPGLTESDQLILADAITSGGLLISVPEDRVDRLLENLHARGVKDAAVIGEVGRIGSGRIAVVKD